MAEKKKKDEEVAEEESPTPKKRERLYTAEEVENLTEFMRMEPQSAYWTDPRQRYPYYAQTTVPERQKAAGTALGISLGGAALQRGIQASAMFDPALDYARSELAEAAATEKRRLEGISDEKADAIRAAARAGVQTEIAETKSDLGSLMASSQQAPSVRDILAVRETGQDAMVGAAIEAEAIIAKSDLATMEAQQRQAEKAQQRQDEMQGVLHKARTEQLKYTTELVGDVSRAAIEYAANAPAASETPVVDQLMDKGVSMDDIGELHQAARAKGFYPGSQAYRNYMMSHYEGATGKDPDEPKADKAPDVAGAPVTPGRAVYDASAATGQQQAMADVRAQEAKPPPAAVQSAQDAATRLRGGGPSLVENLDPVEGFRPPVPAPEAAPAPVSPLSTAERFAAGVGEPGRITGMMEPATPPPAGAETPPAAPTNNLTTKFIPEYQALDDQLEELELKLLKRGKVPENDPRYTRLALSVQNAENRMRAEAIRSDQNINDLLWPRLKSEAWVARANAIDDARKAQEDNPAFGSRNTVYDLIRRNSGIAKGTDTVVFDKLTGQYFAVETSMGSDLIKNDRRYKKVPIDRYLRGVE